MTIPAYTIRNAAATIVATINPATTTGVTFPIEMPGAGFPQYGEFWNQNVYRLMENFAKPTAPSNPAPGMLWYNSTTKVESYWDGTEWRALLFGPVTIPVSSATLPGLPVYADLTTGIYADGAGQFGISSLGTSVVSFSNASPGVAASTIFGRTDAVRLPSGTTAQRPSAPVVGDTRNNSTFGNGEMYNGTFWAQQLPLKGFAAVVFDGTQSVGVITTLVGKNIASVTKLSTGRYTITFSGTTFGTGNYLILPNARYDSTSGSGIGVTVSPDNQAVSSSACTIQVLAGTSGVTYDADRISIVFLEF